jgi:carbonic anhydrase
MPTPYFSRSLTACAVTAALLIPSVHASDAPAAPTKKTDVKKLEIKPVGEAPAVATAAAAPEPAAATAAAAATTTRERRDPLDIVRERLAEKLGAGRSASSGGSSVIRVISNPSSAPPAVPAPAHPAARSKAHSTHTASNSNAAKAAADAHRSAVPDGHSAAAHAPHWDYQGEGGPQAWAQLKNEFSTCATGKRQSPIDIRDGIKVQLDSVQFDYRSSNFRVLDNGHTVQVNVSPGNFIEVTGKRFELLQFHFHRPSEERINGRLFDMVAHLVHKDTEGRLAVVAVLLDRGNAQPLVQAIWNNLPLEKGDEVIARLPLDLNELLPTERSYYTYMGSLTTPPCSEGVLWMVMKTPVTISAEQIAIFSRLYPMNARPIQSASGRLIKESN